jgi:Astacin (Peptidase family M12A)
MQGTAYDYESITHYPSTAFSKNGSATIVAKEAEKDQLMVTKISTITLRNSENISFLSLAGTTRPSQFRRHYTH